MVSREFRSKLTKQKTRAEMAQDVVAKWKKSVKAVSLYMAPSCDSCTCYIIRTCDMLEICT